MAESLKQKVALGHRQCEWASYSGKSVSKSIWEKMLFPFSLLNIWWCSLLTWHNALSLYFLLLTRYWQLNLLIVLEKSLCVISRCTEALCLKQWDCSSEVAYLLNWHHLFLCRPSFYWGVSVPSCLSVGTFAWLQLLRKGLNLCWKVSVPYQRTQIFFSVPFLTPSSPCTPKSHLLCLMLWLAEPGTSESLVLTREPGFEGSLNLVILCINPRGSTLIMYFQG